MKKIPYFIVLSVITQGHFLQATSTDKTPESSQDHSSVNHFNNIFSLIARDEKNGTITPETAHNYRKILYSFDTIDDMIDYLTKKPDNNIFLKIFIRIVIVENFTIISFALLNLQNLFKERDTALKGLMFAIALEGPLLIMAAFFSLLLVILLKGLELLFSKEEKEDDIVQLFAEYLQENWNSYEIVFRPEKPSNVLPLPLQKLTND